MVQERQQEIVNELLNYMDTLEDGSEVSTWDLMDEVFNYQRFNDGYCFNDFSLLSCFIGINIILYRYLHFFFLYYYLFVQIYQIFS